MLLLQFEFDRFFAATVLGQTASGSADLPTSPNSWWTWPPTHPHSTIGSYGTVSNQSSKPLALRHSKNNVFFKNNPYIYIYSWVVKSPIYSKMFPGFWFHTSTSTTASRSFPGSTVKTWCLNPSARHGENDGFMGKKSMVVSGSRKRW